MKKSKLQIQQHQNGVLANTGEVEKWKFIFSVRHVEEVQNSLTDFSMGVFFLRSVPLKRVYTTDWDLFPFPCLLPALPPAWIIEFRELKGDKRITIETSFISKPKSITEVVMYK